jgi:hypothetical protein
MKLSQRLQQEKEFVERKLEGKVICQECQCTLLTFADRCVADLSRCCEGYRSIEAAKSEFNAGRGFRA